MTKDYFYGLTTEDSRLERRTIRERLMLWVCRLGVALALAMILLQLAACATTPSGPIAQVCYLRMMGTTEEGYTVVLQACQSPEDYKASQQ